MISVLSHRFGLAHLDLLMDVVQDSFETALRQWKFGDIPDNPAGWLMQVARNKAINALKRESRLASFDTAKFHENGGGETVRDSTGHFRPHDVEDSQLRLLLLCCHSDLTERTQVMLTLNILCGFSTVEISNALLMKPEAVKKSLFRAKKHLREKNDFLNSPDLLGLESRIHTVHTILYLMFNEGYKSTRSRQIIDHDMCYEAMRLTKLLLQKGVALQGNSQALLALMFFNAARFPSRISAEDEIVSLPAQDRTRWNKTLIREGYFYLNEATTGDELSRFHLEAIIASLHCASASFEQTDWEKIVFLYGQLQELDPSPFSRLNMIVAKSYLHNAEIALTELERLSLTEDLADHYLLHASRGDLLKRAGKLKLAREAYIKALALVQSPLERHFLEKQLLKCHNNQSP